MDTPRDKGPFSPENLLPKAQECKDAQAFEILYWEYRTRVKSYLLPYVRSFDTADDLTQDVFLRVWKFFYAQDSIPGLVDYFEPWLFRVARNLAIDYLRHEQHYEFVQLTDTDQWLLPTMPGPEQSVCEQLYIEEWLGKMSPQYRACLLLRAEKGLSLREIAEELGISEKTVSSNISRARHSFVPELGSAADGAVRRCTA